MPSLRRVSLVILPVAAIFYIFLISYWKFDYFPVSPRPSGPPEVTYDSPEDFENFDNVSGTPDGRYIVPNYVHFLRLGQPKFSFIDAVCVLAALKNQRPERLYFHTDVPLFAGKYWRVLVDDEHFRRAVTVKYVEVPLGVYGQPFRKQWRNFHGGDILRLRILMEYGGIFLDNDSYIVKSLNDLRRYEMAMGWKEGGHLANQVIVAHKNARFLRLWLSSYRRYNSTSWYYNAGIKPTREILAYRPHLIHRMKRLLAAHDNMVQRLYMQLWPGWRSHYAIHLLARHQYLLKNVTGVATYPVVFDERNIKNYAVTFRDMVYDVYPMEFSDGDSAQ